AWFRTADARHDAARAVPDDDATAASYDETFALSLTHNRPDASYGFFGEATVGGAAMPVMGNVQEMFFDRPKVSGEATQKALRGLRDQLRAFALRYFMRVSDFRRPEPFPDASQTPPAYLKALSWCPETTDPAAGFGFTQHLYRRRDGVVGRFDDAAQHAIVDLRRLRTDYAWIVVKVDIFDFAFSAAPLGPGTPALRVPLAESSYLVLSSDFLIDESDDDDPERLGRYGLGYAFLPAPDDDSVLAYGPGRFEAAIQQIEFAIDRKGTITARMGFVANRPEQVLDVSLDPMRWGMRMADAAAEMPMPGAGAVAGARDAMMRVMDPMRRLIDRLPGGAMLSDGASLGVDPVSAYVLFANLVSGGAAGRDLCIDRATLEREFLLQHFTQHYNVIAGALVTWRQIADWTDANGLPGWVETGVSS
ncbi:MAG: hypothetical protein AAF772_15425, partial [Acidobacteriota bacterium]